MAFFLVACPGDVWALSANWERDCDSTLTKEGSQGNDQVLTRTICSQMDRVPLDSELDPHIGLFCESALSEYPLNLCLLLAHWFSHSYPRLPCLWGVTLPVMSGHIRRSRGSQQHTAFMQWGGTLAFLQWNAQINSPLLAAFPAEKTQGSSACSSTRGGLRTGGVSRPHSSALAWSSVLFHYLESPWAREGSEDSRRAGRNQKSSDQLSF